VNRYKILYVVLSFILVLSLLLVGCSNSAQNDGKNKDLTVAVASNPSTLDPHDTQDAVAYGIQNPMYEGLIAFDQDNKLVPVLAESLPELSKDALSLTFKLKQGIKFQDGTDFNADAVKANIDRLKNPNNKLKRASLFVAVDHVEVIDPYTVKIVLSKPFAAIVQTFAHPAAAMISPKVIAEVGGDISRHPAGTGPYEFVEWKDGQYIAMKKFDGYWNKDNMPALNKITFKFVTEAGSRVAMLKTGEAQYVYPLPPEQVENIKTDKNLTVEESSSVGERFIAFNMTKKPFTDKKVRQALNYAIDKDTLINVVLKGFGTPAESAIAPKVWGFQKQQMYPYDIEKAKQLLTEAGYPEGFETTFWCSNSTETLRLAEFIQQQWQAVGVKINLQTFESAAWIKQVSVKPEESQMQVTTTSWSPSTGEADWGIRPLMSKDMFPTAGFNFGFYSNEQVEKDLIVGVQSGDDAERLQAYADAQKRIVEDAPWVFLYVNKNVAAKRNNLAGIYVLPDGTINAAHAKFE